MQTLYSLGVSIKRFEGWCRPVECRFVGKEREPCVSNGHDRCGELLIEDAPGLRPKLQQFNRPGTEVELEHIRLFVVSI